MKACPNKRILALFDSMGLHIDASSGHEVKRAIHAGIDPQKISLMRRKFPKIWMPYSTWGSNLMPARSIRLSDLGRFGHGGALGIRFNPIGDRVETIGRMSAAYPRVLVSGMSLFLR